MTVAGFEFPDECQPACRFNGDFQRFGQGSICIRCPVFNCKEVPGPDGKPFCLVEPDEYRKDWAEAWHKFFETGEEPTLQLYQPGERGYVTTVPCDDGHDELMRRRRSGLVRAEDIAPDAPPRRQ